MEQFCIIVNHTKSGAASVMKWIAEYLVRCGKRVFTADVQQDKYGVYFTDPSTIPEGTECIIVLGGDGTILQAANDLKDLNIPFFGVNLGTLGFLSETEQQNIAPALQRMADGFYTIESRMMLSLKPNPAFHFPPYSCALNDIVITRSGFSRLINLHVFVNDDFVNEYRGDGIILATPTGSTGYNLSAGGPVAAPETDLILITPICPHSLNARSIVVSSKDTVRVQICTSKKTQEEEAIVTVDGNEALHLKAEDFIEVEQALTKIRLLRLKDNNFYDILRKKLLK